MVASRARATGARPRGVPRRSPVRSAATAVGAILLLIGVLGFVPAATTHGDQLQLAGYESGAKLFGVFQVSVLHNVVHVLFGLAGLAMSRTVLGARTFLLGGGAIYLAVWLYGTSIGHRGGASVPPNSAADWLHLGLGVAMIVLGLTAPRGRARA
jgi:hypothetical protein